MIKNKHKKDCENDKCFYCKKFIKDKHEHDHFPVPKNSGGTNIVCSCIDCHDLKDRLNIKNWTVEQVVEAFNDVTSTQMGRIYFAKMYKILCNLELENKKLRKKLKT